MVLAVFSRKRIKLALLCGLAAASLFIPVTAIAETESTDLTTTQQQDEEKRSKADDNQERAQRCGRRQQAVNRRANGINQLAAKQLALLNSVLEKAQQYVDNQHLDVNNYSGLLNAAESAGSDASADVEALKTGPQLNCNRDDNKGDIRTYQTKVQQLGSSLKAYRQALRELLKNIKTAAGPLDIVR